MIRMSNDIRKYLQIGGIGLAFAVSLAFSFGRQDFRTTEQVHVLIDNTLENYFIENEEIISLMNGGERDYVTGSFLSDVDLKQLEKNIETHPYVENAQVYRDLKGVITVEVSQKRPIARIFNSKGPDHYITAHGEIVPESKKYTARVPLVEMDNPGLIGEQSLQENDYGTNLLSLLSEINNDQFWRAQIAGLMIDRDGEILLQPQVTKQIVDFGYPEDIESKLKKLALFYKEILPVQGWNSYNRVTLKYDNQIICE